MKKSILLNSTISNIPHLPETHPLATLQKVDIGSAIINDNCLDSNNIQADLWDAVQQNGTVRFHAARASGVTTGLITTILAKIYTERDLQIGFFVRNRQCRDNTLHLFLDMYHRLHTVTPPEITVEFHNGLVTFDNGNKLRVISTYQQTRGMDLDVAYCDDIDPLVYMPNHERDSLKCALDLISTKQPDNFDQRDSSVGQIVIAATHENCW